MNTEFFALIVNTGLPLLFVILGYFVGRSQEKSHLKSIEKRERASLRFPVINNVELKDCDHVDFVAAEVVISIDYFKRLAAGLRNLFGGNVTFYESLLARARREAVLRMKESARSKGASGVCHLRIKTSNIGGGQGGVTGVEVIAMGTAFFKRKSINEDKPKTSK